MKCSLILTANAGVILSTGGNELLVDALHDEKAAAFSTTPPHVLDWVRARYRFCPPHVVLATHGHSDHTSLSLWENARRLWPVSSFISPGPPLGGTFVLNEPQQKIVLDGITIDAKQLPHDGVMFNDVTNYGYFLDIKGFTVLIPGDCATTAFDELAELISGRQVDLALMNFTWVTLSRPRAFLQAVIAPSHLSIFHLPFAHDDREGYQAATQKAIQKMTLERVSLLTEPLQQVLID